METNNKFGILLVVTIAAFIVIVGLVWDNINLKTENAQLKERKTVDDNKCFLKLSSGECIPQDKIGVIKRTSRDTLCAQINCTNTTQYRRGLVMLIIAEDLQDKKIILLE